VFTISEKIKNIVMRGKTAYACKTNTCNHFKTFRSAVTPVAAPFTAAKAVSSSSKKADERLKMKDSK
jgi:hypothetical protein